MFLPCSLYVPSVFPQVGNMFPMASRNLAFPSRLSPRCAYRLPLLLRVADSRELRGVAVHDPLFAVAPAHVANVTRFVTDDFFRKMEESVLGQQ